MGQPLDHDGGAWMAVTVASFCHKLVILSFTFVTAACPVKALFLGVPASAPTNLNRARPGSQPTEPHRKGSR